MSHKPKYLDPKILRATLAYDPITGHISSLKANQRNPAGYIYKVEAAGNYLSVPYGKSSARAGRVAWVLMTGKQPEIIDHINGIKHDNSWSNLRNVSVAGNCSNRESARIKNGTYVPLEDPDQYAHDY